MRRSAALGASAAMLLSIPVVGAGPATAVDDPLLPGVPLSADVIDVTDDDADLGTVAREVVVMLQTADGPEIRKLRTDTRAQAVALAEDLDGRPGLVAEVNQVVSIPQAPVVTGDAGASGPGFTRSAAGGSTVQAVPPLSAETFGADQWGLRWVGAEPAWQVTRGELVTVAVIDTGVDATHTDLVERTLPQLDLVPDGLTGDPQGHGTHVAGIIGASLDGSGVAGLANLVRILPVRVMDADGTGDTQTIATGIIAAVDAGAQVINMSIGSTTPSAVEESAVKYAVDHGVSVVASCGNGFEQGNPVNYPAASPGVLGVASVGERNEGASLARSPFSNTGVYIDLTAPGEQIASTVPGNQWAYKSGTSMAAPFVAAGAALVRAANPSFTKEQVDEALQSTAWDDGSGNGRDDVFGWGLLQADAAALKAAYAPGGLTPDSDGDGIPDTADPCPSVAGPAGGTGCPPPPPDADGDGLPDSQDPCPAEAGPAGGNGCPVDSDGDGLLDPQDPCPAAAGPTGVSGCPLPPGPTGPTVVVRVKAKSSGSKLFVDVDPNKGSGYWRFQVQRLDTGTMTWKARKTYRTQGSKETRTINLPKGTYRVVVAGKYGYLGDASAGVKLRR